MKFTHFGGGTIEQEYMELESDKREIRRKLKKEISPLNYII